MKPILFASLLALPLWAFSQTEKGITRPPSTVWAVIVGISDYQEKDIPDLRFSAATAT
jgi:hypothetical protein